MLNSLKKPMSLPGWQQWLARVLDPRVQAPSMEIQRCRYPFIFLCKGMMLSVVSLCGNNSTTIRLHTGTKAVKKVVAEDNATLSYRRSSHYFFLSFILITSMYEDPLAMYLRTFFWSFVSSACCCLWHGPIVGCHSPTLRTWPAYIICSCCVRIAQNFPQVTKTFS